MEWYMTGAYLWV